MALGAAAGFGLASAPALAVASLGIGTAVGAGMLAARAGRRATPADDAPATLGTSEPREGGRTLGASTLRFDALAPLLTALDRRLDRLGELGAIGVVVLRLDDAGAPLDAVLIGGLLAPIAVAPIDVDTWVALASEQDVEGYADLITRRAARRFGEGRARVGVSLAPTDARTAATAVDRAVLAALSSPGGSVCWHRPETRARLRHERNLGTGIRAALHAGQLEPWYQPIVDARTLAPVGAEVLVRWRHPGLGTLAPTAFLPLVEARGALIDLGHEVVRAAVPTGARWHQERTDGFLLSLNLFPEQLRDRWALASLRALLRRSDVPTARVQVEVPLAAVLDASALVRRNLCELRDFGVRIALDHVDDDVRKLQAVDVRHVTGLRIDLGAFRRERRRIDGRALTATLELAADQGLDVDVCRVETEAERDALGRLHTVDRLQGDVIGTPVDAVTFEAVFLTGPPCGPTLRTG